MRIIFLVWGYMGVTKGIIYYGFKVKRLGLGFRVEGLGGSALGVYVWAILG